LAPEKPRGITPERLREVEDAFCLMDHDSDRKIIGGLMRGRRLRREAAEAAAAQSDPPDDTTEPANSDPQPETPVESSSSSPPASDSSASPTLNFEPGTLNSEPPAPVPGSHDLTSPVPEFCPRCYSPLPGLIGENGRPFPRCRSCGYRLPPPGQALSAPPAHPPPHKPQDYCPHCSVLLPPLCPNGERPDAWCPHCTTPLPDPGATIEHCPSCGQCVPPVAPGDARPSTCTHCGCVLPPPLPPNPPTGAEAILTNFD
jgi:hypothetical protein